MEDETSCPVICSHPACWLSNLRREKGFPHLVEPDRQSQGEPESDLPVIKVYNMLDEYGENAFDRFPSSTGGRPQHMSTQGSAFPHDYFSRTMETWDETSSEPTPLARPPPKCNFVEVQEVFDVDELHSRWEEAFLTKQYYVWVPNSRKPVKPASVKEPKETMSYTRDMTENLLPKDVARDRENNGLKKVLKPAPRSSIPNRSFSKSAAWPVNRPKPVVDAEGDFTSRERIEEIINQVAPTVDRGMSQVSLASGDLLMQRKVQLLGEKGRNLRGSHLMSTQPVFQLDRGMVPATLAEREEASSAAVPGTRGPGSETETGTGTEVASWGKFPRYRRLPRIGGGKRRSKAHVASVSLGLPELPSGVRSTRTFVYKRRNIDFSLGPIPTPPMSVRSTMSGEMEDDSATVRANVYSRSEKNFSEVNTALYRGMDASSQMVGARAPLREMSASSSPRFPKAPHGTPIVLQSPVKGLHGYGREVSGTGEDSREISGPPPSRESSSSVSYGPPRLDLDVDNAAAGLDTIRETFREQGAYTAGGHSRSVHFQEEASGRHAPSTTPEGVTHTPMLPPAHAQLAPPKTYSESATSPIKMAGMSGHREAAAVTGASSPELWPQVSEAAYEAATPAGVIIVPSPYGPGPNSSRGEHERSSLSSGRRDRDPGSGGSNREMLTRMMGEVQRITESPAPPPPSPEREEPGTVIASEKGETTDGKLRSRGSVSMMPLIEEAEAGDPENQAALAANSERGYAETVSSVEPRGSQRKAGKKKAKVVDTFDNVHIPATFDLAPDGTATEASTQREESSVFTDGGGGVQHMDHAGESQPRSLEDRAADLLPRREVERSQADGGIEPGIVIPTAPPPPPLATEITYSTFSSVSKVADSGEKERTQEGLDLDTAKTSPKGDRGPSDGEPSSQEGSRGTRTGSQDNLEPPAVFALESSGASEKTFARNQAGEEVEDEVSNARPSSQTQKVFGQGGSGNEEEVGSGENLERPPADGMKDPQEAASGQENAGEPSGTADGEEAPAAGDAARGEGAEDEGVEKEYKEELMQEYEKLSR